MITCSVLFSVMATGVTVSAQIVNIDATFTNLDLRTCGGIQTYLVAPGGSIDFSGSISYSGTGPSMGAGSPNLGYIGSSPADLSHFTCFASTGINAVSASNTAGGKICEVSFQNSGSQVTGTGDYTIFADSGTPNGCYQFGLTSVQAPVLEENFYLTVCTPSSCVGKCGGPNGCGGTCPTISCDDGNSCTSDVCSSSTWTCSNTAQGQHLECSANSCQQVNNTPTLCANRDGCTSQGSVCGVTAACSGTISALPGSGNLCAVQLGTSNITWSSLNCTNVNVFVSDNGAAETAFAGGPGGSQSAPWIQGGHVYVFSLRSGGAGGPLISTASVNATTLTCASGCSGSFPTASCAGCSANQGQSCSSNANCGGVYACDGTTCTGGVACNSGQTCSSGTCVNDSSCVTNWGQSCNDGNACSAGEIIDCSGACSGGTASGIHLGCVNNTCQSVANTLSVCTNACSTNSDCGSIAPPPPPPPIGTSPTPTPNQPICVPDCSGKQCGSDNCGGTCGACIEPDTCGGGGVANVCGNYTAPPPAAVPPDTTMYDLTRYNPLSDLSFSRLFCTAANWLVTIGLILVVIIIALAGIFFITSRGDEQKRRKGKSTLENAVIGLLILLFAKGIILVILTFVGLPLTSMTC